MRLNAPGRKPSSGAFGDTDGGMTTGYIFGDYRVSAATGEAFVYYRFGGRAVAWSGNSFLNYLLADHLASSHGEANSSGGQVGQRRYKPFGSDRAVSGASDLTVDERYTAQRRLDAGGGNANRELYHHGARWYLPGVGIFTQPDPLGPDRRNPQRLNHYSYVLNNPLRFADPTGLQEENWDEAPLDGAPTDPPDPDLEGSPGDAVEAAVMDVIADQPTWFDLGWQWEFRASHGGAGPTAGDYLDRHASMAEASGMGGEAAAEAPAPGGTWSVGVGGGTYGGGIGIRGSLVAAWDARGDWALLLSFGGGGYTTLGAGAGIQGGWTNAPSVGDLTEWSAQAGGSVGEGFGGGAEWVGAAKYQGVTGWVGVTAKAPLPWEIHGTTEYTWMILGPGNPFDLSRTR